MSVLVWDGKTLACDTAANDGHVKFPIQKIWKLADGAIGGVGTVHEIFALRQWVLEGRQVSQFPRVSEHSHFVFVTPAKGLLRYHRTPVAIVHGFESCAFGSGKDFAYGAMAMAQVLRQPFNAEQVVLATMQHALHCGGSVTKIDVVREDPDGRSPVIG